MRADTSAGPSQPIRASQTSACLLQTHSLRHEGRVSFHSLNQRLLEEPSCSTLETRHTKNTTAYSAWCVQGPGWRVGVAAGTKLWLANQQKVSRSSPLNSRIQTRQTDRQDAAQEEEPEPCQPRGGGAGSRQEELTPARHSWPCRCPSKRTFAGLSPAPCAGILHPKSGCDRKNNKRRAVTPQNLFNNTCQLGCRSRIVFTGMLPPTKRLSVQREAALRDPVIPS